ncbi:hypothetical protein D3C72_1976760 [compost metagenome]
MYADPYIQRPVNERRDAFAHRERCITGLHRVVFMCDRRPKQCCHTIASELGDQAAESPNSVDHCFQHSVDALKRNLGIHVANRLAHARAEHT